MRSHVGTPSLQHTDCCCCFRKMEIQRREESKNGISKQNAAAVWLRGKAAAHVRLTEPRQAGWALSHTRRTQRRADIPEVPHPSHSSSLSSSRLWLSAPSTLFHPSLTSCSFNSSNFSTVTPLKKRKMHRKRVKVIKHSSRAGSR